MAQFFLKVNGFKVPVPNDSLDDFTDQVMLNGRSTRVVKREHINHIDVVFG